MKIRLATFLLFISAALCAQPIGHLNQDLKAKEAYMGQSAYMDFYHGLSLSQPGVDISLSGLLSIDGTISSGNIYEQDINRLYPFPNTIVILRMTGEEIRQYLEASYAAWINTIAGAEDELLQTKSLAKADGSTKLNFKNSPANFDSGAGINYTVDATKEAGSRVSIASMADGSPFRQKATYNVAINNYRASGAGKLLQAAGIDPKNMEDRIIAKDKPFRDILREYLSANDGVIDPARMKCGSWSFIPQQMATYSAKRTLSKIFGTPENPYYDTKSEIEADTERCGGVYYMYPENQPKPTKAPRGYKAYYISHLGRHGARYALGNTIYTDIMNVLARADSNGLLTAGGKVFKASYDKFYPTVAQREGILTRKGQAQQRYIAEQMLRNYPEVFKGNTSAVAVSTHSHRVIASMYNFLAQLDSLDKSFVFSTDYGAPYQGVLSPSAEKEAAAWPKSVEKKVNRFCDDRLDSDAILRRFFTEPDSLGGDKYKLCLSLNTLVSDFDNLDTPVPSELQNLLSARERYRIWEVYNYYGYLRYGLAPDVKNIRAEAMRPLLKEILDYADTDAKEGIALRLRFAHDTSLLPLLSLMDVNGMGVQISDPYEVENYWRTYDIPMACNLQLVFFRKGKGDDILVQILLNGHEATLPLEMAAPGSFYRWNDIKKLYATF